MNTKLSGVLLGTLLAACLARGAEQGVGGLDYVVTGDAVTIRGWSSATNRVEIPAEIEGKPVRSIGPRAFAGKTGLVYVSIPDSVQEIGDEAFQKCYALACVRFGQSVTNIGKSAFAYCGALGGIVLPDALVRIGPRAFLCTQITRLALPAGLRECGEWAFAECFRLREITLAPGNETFTLQDQVLFDRQQTTLLLYPAERPGTNYVIPDGVTCVGAAAFYGCTNLVGVTIGPRVTNICAEAFSRCADLQRVTMSDSVVRLGESAFWACRRLSEVALSANLDRLEMAVFRSCPSLRNIRIPDGVREIGPYAFESCGLTNITWGRDLRTIGMRAFGLCEMLRSIQLPQGLEAVGDDAFMRCPLRRVVLPASVKQIGADPFYVCRELAEIVVEEGSSAFRSVDGVLFDAAGKTLLIYPLAHGGTEYRIPEGVEALNRHAFVMAKGLTNVVFPASLTRIGESAFGGAEKLGRLELPDALAVVDRNAFSACRAVTEVSSLGKVRSLAPDTFRSCESLARVVLPDGLTEIGGNVFQGTALSRVVIPAGVRRIDPGAFSQCRALREVLFEGDAPVMATGTFRDSPARLFYRPETKGWTNDLVAGCPASCMDHVSRLAYVPQADGAVAVAGYLGTGRVVHVPAVLGGRPVTAIREGAFEGQFSLEECWLPPGVTSLAARAFSGCTNLSRVICEGEAPQVGSAVFKDVPATVYRPFGATGWEASLSGRPTQASLIDSGLAFRELAGGVSEIVRYFGTNHTAMIPSEVAGRPVASLADNAFAGCGALSGVVLPASVRRIGRRAFDGCYRLVAVEGAAGVTEVDEGAFDACYALTNTVVAGVKVGGGAVAVGAGTERLALQLELATGDSFTGTNALRTVSLQGSDALRVVPLAHIDEIRLGAGTATASVRLRNGDCLEGALLLSQVGLQTIYASLQLDVRTVRSIRVLRVP